MLIFKNCIKHVCSSQQSPRTMHTWERLLDFIILKWVLKVIILLLLCIGY